MTVPPHPPPSFATLDWTTYVPRDRATLVFIRRDREVLLIRKKRGLGAGKINAPGGRLEPGETPEEAAIREVREEVGLDVHSPRLAGELSFQFTDGYSLHATVYVAERFAGVPTETDEAFPFWVDEDSIPYDEMWADDVLWLPWLLMGTPFVGRFLFDGDTLLGHELSADPSG